MPKKRKREKRTARLMRSETNASESRKHTNTNNGKTVFGWSCLVLALFLLIFEGRHYISFALLFAGIGAYLILKPMAEQGKIKFPLREESKEEAKQNKITEEAQSVPNIPLTAEKITAEAPKTNKSVKSPAEERIEKWSAQLKERESAIEEREHRIAIIYRDQQELIEELQKQKLSEKELEQLQENIAKLRRTERGIYDWIKRRESDEIALFEKIMQDTERYKQLAARYAEMDGDKFEGYIADLLNKNGYENAAITQKSRDYGGDVTAEKDGVKYVFQCKYYASPVGIAAVQQVFSAKEHYNAHVAVVVTNNLFTKAAQLLAEESGVVLWDCSKVEELENLANHAAIGPR